MGGYNWASEPVFALAYGKLKSGKCLPGSTEVRLANGERVRLEKLVEVGKPVEVESTVCYAGDGARRVAAVSTATEFVSNGVKPCVHIRTLGHRDVCATLQHPFWAPDGWVIAAAFQPGDRIGVLLEDGTFAWDRVDEVVDAGTAATYDIVVPNGHNFIADDFVSHNTSDLLFSFPRAMFLADRGSLKPSVRLCGFEPENVELANDVPEVLAGIKNARAKGIKFCVIDDYSLIADRAQQRLERRFTGWKLFGEMKNELLSLRTAARDAGIHVIVTAHQKEAKNINGTNLLGGPNLPGAMQEAFPSAVDMVLRVVFESSHPLWQAAYRSGLDPNWVQGDRLHICPDPAPLNLGEILRSAGYDVPRLESWMDAAVEQASAFLNSMPSPKDGIKAVYEAFIADGKPPPHAYWVTRDAFDRVLLARSKKTLRLGPPSVGFQV